MPKIKFAEIKDKIVNNRGFNSIKEIKKAGLRIVKPSKYKKGDKDYKLFLIEEKYLKPVIKSPRELKSIVVKKEDLKYKAFMCNESKKDLKNSFALDYIKWGETDKEWFDQKMRRLNPPYKRPTCKSRKYWWRLDNQKKQDFILLRFRDERNWSPIPTSGILIGDVVFVGKWRNAGDSDLLNSYMNCTILFLFIEIYGRKNLAQGLLTTYGPELLLLHILLPKALQKRKSDVMLSFSKLKAREPLSIFTELGFDKDKPIRSQEPNPLPDRAALDKIVFDVLGLTEKERKEVYWSVAELVKNRLDKAKSLKKKQ